MVQTIPAKDLTLYDVKVKFGLKLSEDDQFFRQWIDDLPEITDLEKRSLDQVKAGYLHLSEYPMPDSLFKMVVLSPLLALAGFYRPPFRVTAEAPLQIAAEDEAQYALSDEFTLRRGHDIYNVLRILKRLGALLTQDSK